MTATIDRKKLLDRVSASLADVAAREEARKPSSPRDRVRLVELSTSRFEFRSTDTQGKLGTLFGYAAVFNRWTEIDSWEGHFLERIAPGAFAKTLRAHGDRVKVLFNHGFDPQVGDKPLGKPSVMEEDRTGLRVEVPLDNTSYNRDLIESIRSGAIDGMSFRFQVGEDTVAKPAAASTHNPTLLPERTITEFARLWEFGPVTFQAYQEASADVRHRQVSREVSSGRRLPAAKARTVKLQAKVLETRACLAVIDADAAIRKYGNIPSARELEARRRRRLIARTTAVRVAAQVAGMGRRAG